MAKITITIDDTPAGTTIVCSPSIGPLQNRAAVGGSVTVGEALALAAWAAIAKGALEIADETGGRHEAGELH